MDERKSYIEKMQGALGELKVKSSLAKLELGDKKDELIEQYDKLHDDLRRMREESGERWYALQTAFEAGWKTFRSNYDSVMKKFREP